ncbi:Zinc finger matrin-type protein 4 [Labeo rohita]|uniref:Zinc finger matrin-type protein 4 n=1 Tax=Labeo rohita TaxID=84645 RepID=A0ABQ8M546_LABRO|nr:Zinc finger matrin-type protein 4 [Labeo rohita]
MISWTIALKGRSVNWDSSWLLFLPDLLKADLFPAALDQDLTHSRGGWENAKGPVCARIDSGPVIHSPVSRDEKDSSSHWQQLTAHTQCGHNHTLDSAENEVDRNKCCTLCNMFFTSAIVAQSHYQGKTHAKRVRLVLGETPSLPTPTESAPPTTQTTDTPPPSWQPLANHGEAGKYCCLCGAWFNNPLMAQQHYEGKKHKRNAARARLLEQLAGSLDANESTGQCSIA